MSLKERNSIVPQMRDYDQIGDRWLPYLMRFDSPSKNFKSVSTDQWGFRTTIDREGNSIDLHESRKSDNPANIVLGSSAVFGVGATRNSRTISSYLNQGSDREWWNYGGRALNSTQELILLQLFLPKNVETIVVCSGVNNLTLAGVSDTCSPIYNSFYYQTMFERAMQNPPKEYVGIRQALKLVQHAIFSKSSHSKESQGEQSIEQRYESVLECLRRDIRCLAALSSGLGAKFYFALQPFATWIDKPLSSEEQRIFSILDNMSRDWNVLARLLGSFQQRYSEDVSKICKDYSVPFIDLNKSSSFCIDEWLFVDRIHLTDKGYSVISEELIMNFQL